jgi:hypothetical protein
MNSSSFVKSWQTRRLRGEISIQDRLLCSWVLTNFEINLAPSLLNFVRHAVPVPLVFLNYYRPGLLYPDFGDAKTLVRWTRNHIGLLLSISWRCWVYLPVPSPKFMLFGRRGGVTLARFSCFPGTCKYPSTFSLRRCYLKTLPHTSCSIFKDFIYINNDTAAASVDCTKFSRLCVHTQL